MHRFFAALIATLFVSHMASAQTQVRSLTVGGAVREYLLFVPDGVPARETLPLVVLLHGGGAPAELMALYSRFNAIARRERFAVAYPRGIGRWWNDRRLSDAQAESTADDIGFVRALVADIGEALPLDRSRIFAAGISNGGFMSLRLACEAADLFAAVAPVAATMPAEVGARCRPSKPVSLLVINGTADAYATRAPPMRSRARSGRRSARSLSGPRRTVAPSPPTCASCPISIPATARA